MRPSIRTGASLRIIVLLWMGFSGYRERAPWRDLPKEFDKWSSVYRQFRRWTLAGLWENILDALNRVGVAPDKLQTVDIEPVCATGSSEPARVIRAHHHAVGEKWGLLTRDRWPFERWVRDQIHLRVNGAGLPMRTEITPGQDSDDTGYDLVMADNLPQPPLIADKGYDSDKIRENIEGRNAPPMMPMRENRKVRTVVDMTIYTLRNMVERCFNKLKSSPRLATRYDKTAGSFLGFVDIACTRLWLSHLPT